MARRIANPPIMLKRLNRVCIEKSQVVWYRRIGQDDTDCRPSFLVKTQILPAASTGQVPYRLDPLI
jgi:hypothetical protein